MKLSIGSQTYTNVILTMIAVLLLALAFDAYRVSVLPAAQAQQSGSIFQKPQDESGQNGNVSQTQDVAVAAATREVAVANREIAGAIRECGKNLDSLASAIRAAGAAKSSGTTPTSAAPAPASDGIQFSTGSPK